MEVVVRFRLLPEKKSFVKRLGFYSKRKSFVKRSKFLPRKKATNNKLVKIIEKRHLGSGVGRLVAEQLQFTCRFNFLYLSYSTSLYLFFYYYCSVLQYCVYCFLFVHPIKLGSFFIAIIFKTIFTFLWGCLFDFHPSLPAILQLYRRWLAGETYSENFIFLLTSKPLPSSL